VRVIQCRLAKVVLECRDFGQVGQADPANRDVGTLLGNVVEPAAHQVVAHQRRTMTLVGPVRMR